MTNEIEMKDKKKKKKKWRQVTKMAPVVSGVGPSYCLKFIHERWSFVRFKS